MHSFYNKVKCLLRSAQFFKPFEIYFEGSKAIIYFLFCWQMSLPLIYMLEIFSQGHFEDLQFGSFSHLLS